jgi:hypothetical protein
MTCAAENPQNPASATPGLNGKTQQFLRLIEEVHGPIAGIAFHLMPPIREVSIRNSVLPEASLEARTGRLIVVGTRGSLTFDSVLKPHSGITTCLGVRNDLPSRRSNFRCRGIQMKSADLQTEFTRTPPRTRYEISSLLKQQMIRISVIDGVFQCGSGVADAGLCSSSTAQVLPAIRLRRGTIGGT